MRPDKEETPRANEGSVSAHQEKETNMEIMSPSTSIDKLADQAPATCVFKDAGDHTVETRRQDGGPWRVGIEGWDRVMTAAEARIVAKELHNAADGVAGMNRQRSASKIEGRELLLIDSRYGFEQDLAVFADGKPKRVVRLTRSDSDEVRLFPVSDAWHEGRDAPSTVTDGRGKKEVHRTYEVVGRYELLITGTQDERLLLVARVDPAIAPDDPAGSATPEDGREIDAMTIEEPDELIAAKDAEDALAQATPCDK